MAFVLYFPIVIPCLIESVVPYFNIPCFSLLLLLGFVLNPLNTKFTKWSNTLKQFVSKLPTNCLSVFDHFVGLAFKGLNIMLMKKLLKNIETLTSELA